MINKNSIIQKKRWARKYSHYYLKHKIGLTNLSNAQIVDKLYELKEIKDKGSKKKYGDKILDWYVNLTEIQKNLISATIKENKKACINKNHNEKNQKKSIKIYYDNNIYKSLLEFKYCLTIEENYNYVYEPILFESNELKYLPDFLIQHKKTKEFTFVEIKTSKEIKNKQVLAKKELILRFKDKLPFAFGYIIITEKDFEMNLLQRYKFNRQKTQQISYNKFAYGDAKCNVCKREFSNALLFFSHLKKEHNDTRYYPSHKNELFNNFCDTYRL